MNSVLHGFDEGQIGQLAVRVLASGPETVQLIYDDNGRGIAPEHRSRVFDPFFTTRRGSGCTGLGLHIVYNLARAGLGGTVHLDETSKEGARFVLEFPRTAPS